MSSRQVWVTVRPSLNMSTAEHLIRTFYITPWAYIKQKFLKHPSILYSIILRKNFKFKESLVKLLT